MYGTKASSTAFPLTSVDSSSSVKTSLQVFPCVQQGLFPFYLSCSKLCHHLYVRVYSSIISFTNQTGDSSLSITPIQSSSVHDYFFSAHHNLVFFCFGVYDDLYLVLCVNRSHYVQFAGPKH